MSDNNDEPRSSQAPAERSGQSDADKAAPIRNPEAYERSQVEKAARLASKSREEVEALKGEIAGLKGLLSDFVGELKAEKEARAQSERAAQRGQAIQAAVAQFNLPAESAKLLHGDTAEEINANAEALAILLETKVTPQKQTTIQKTRPLPGNTAETVPDDFMARVKSKRTARPDPESNPLFSADAHLAKGGGVVSD